MMFIKADFKIVVLPEALGPVIVRFLLRLIVFLTGVLSFNAP